MSHQNNPARQKGLPGSHRLHNRIGAAALTAAVLAMSVQLWPAQAHAATARPAASAPPLKGDASARSTPVPPMTPLPAWVTPVAVDLDTSTPVDAQGVDYLLVDHQTRVTARDRFSFRHRMDRIRSERGLDGIGQVEVRFNPDYQTLQFHQLRIHRDGRVLPWQQRARARWLDRETQMEQGIYDGTRTLLLTLDDLRVGDVLEYAYTVRGSNPVFGGREFGGNDLQFSVSVARQHVRLLMPAGRQPLIQNSPGVTMQRRTLAGGEEEWVWDLHKSEALHMDANAPRWFYPFARLAWSEFSGWDDVARWAAPMYQTSPTPPPAVQQVVDGLKQRFATPEERIAGALRLVQEQVRYLSVSIGAGSHAPRRPEQVLAQRFGDCKDKSLLTVALLRALGVEAWVALVNTELREHLDEQLASAGAFDHAIVRARWKGKDYWLDPTRAPQRGTLDQLVQANFGRALVIDAETTGLMAMAVAPSAIDRREIEISFNLRDGPLMPAPYDIATRYFGAAAERIRNEYGTGDGRLERLQKLYQGYYARSFNELKVAAPLEWKDDPDANVVTVTEHYTIGKLWNFNAKGQVTDAPLATPEMDTLLRRPDMTQRQHPMALTHPVQLDMTLRAELPKAWPVARSDAGNIKVQDDHFRFHRGYTVRDGVLTVSQSYATLSDHVNPNQMTDYLKHLKEADEWSGYLLRWPKNVPGGSTATSPGEAPGETPGKRSANALKGALALLGIGLCLGWVGWIQPLALRLRHRLERHPLPAGEEKPYRGARGVVFTYAASDGERLPEGPPEIVEGPGRDGWRAWLARWVGTAFALHAVNGLLVWQLFLSQDDRVLLSLTNWIYGLGAIALGHWLTRRTAPWVFEVLRNFHLRRMNETDYRALLWRCGVTDEFPPPFDASVDALYRPSALGEPRSVPAAVEEPAVPA